MRTYTVINRDISIYTCLYIVNKYIHTNTLHLVYCSANIKFATTQQNHIKRQLLVGEIVVPMYP